MAADADNKDIKKVEPNPVAVMASSRLAMWAAIKDINRTPPNVSPSLESCGNLLSSLDAFNGAVTARKDEAGQKVKAGQMSEMDEARLLDSLSAETRQWGDKTKPARDRCAAPNMKGPQ